MRSLTFLSSLRAQHWAQLEMHKTTLREQRMLLVRRPRVKRMASILDFSSTLRPASLLALMILAPLVTLAITYTISWNIIVPDGKGGTTYLFDKKGEWAANLRREICEARKLIGRGGRALDLKNLTPPPHTHPSPQATLYRHQSTTPLRHTSGPLASPAAAF